MRNVHLADIADTALVDDHSAASDLATTVGDDAAARELGNATASNHTAAMNLSHVAAVHNHPPAATAEPAAVPSPATDETAALSSKASGPPATTTDEYNALAPEATGPPAPASDVSATLAPEAAAHPVAAALPVTTTAKFTSAASGSPKLASGVSGLAAATASESSGAAAVGPVGTIGTALANGPTGAATGGGSVRQAEGERRSEECNAEGHGCLLSMVRDSRIRTPPGAFTDFTTLAMEKWPCLRQSCQSPFEASAWAVSLNKVTLCCCSTTKRDIQTRLRFSEGELLGKETAGELVEDVRAHGAPGFFFLNEVEVPVQLMNFVSLKNDDALIAVDDSKRRGKGKPP